MKKINTKHQHERNLWRKLNWLPFAACGLVLASQYFEISHLSKLSDTAIGELPIDSALAPYYAIIVAFMLGNFVFSWFVVARLPIRKKTANGFSSWLFEQSDELSIVSGEPQKRSKNLIFLLLIAGLGLIALEESVKIAISDFICLFGQASYQESCGLVLDFERLIFTYFAVAITGFIWCMIKLLIGRPSSKAA